MTRRNVMVAVAIFYAIRVFYDNKDIATELLVFDPSIGARCDIENIVNASWIG